MKQIEEVAQEVVIADDRSEMEYSDDMFPVSVDPKVKKFITSAALAGNSFQWGFKAPVLMTAAQKKAAKKLAKEKELVKEQRLKSIKEKKSKFADSDSDSDDEDLAFIKEMSTLETVQQTERDGLTTGRPPLSHRSNASGVLSHRSNYSGIDDVGTTELTVANMQTFHPSQRKTLSPRVPGSPSGGATARRMLSTPDTHRSGMNNMFGSPRASSPANITIDADSPLITSRPVTALNRPFESNTEIQQRRQSPRNADAPNSRAGSPNTTSRKRPNLKVNTNILPTASKAKKAGKK